MVNDFPNDYLHLHLLCLGVMKRLLLFRIEGHKMFSTKLSVKLYVDHWMLASKSQPKEFNRKVRCVDQIKHWKGTEFRTFLLYVVFKDLVSSEV